MANEFKHEGRCKICKLKSPKTGEPIRGKVEEMKAQGMGYKEIMLWADQEGTPLSYLNLSRHFSKHAPYVKKGTMMTKQTKRAIMKITKSSEESVNALKKIIAYGSTMIDNWWEGVEGQPQMEVNPKMFMEALKEDGRRSPRTALDAEFEQLQREVIEGGADDDETKEIPDSLS